VPFTRFEKHFFWTIGASGKRTAEAAAAGCVGMFGIGGFADFGICHTLEVVSQSGDATEGTLSRLSETDIQSAGSAVPSVTVEKSGAAAP
jgi:molecular chaperone HtpG